MAFPFYKQLNAMDCGPTCLRMIARHYGRHYNAETIRQKTGFHKQGVSLLGISETAEKMGFRTRGVQISYEKLRTVPLPAILHWNQQHFVVLTAIKKNNVRLADPSRGMISYKKQEFLQYWSFTNIDDVGHIGTALLLEPAPAFYEATGEKETSLSWSNIIQYLKTSRWGLFQVFISLLLSSLLQLILPFLTQTMVDTGINTKNLQYITIVLVAQLMLTFSNTIVGFVRNRIQLRISGNINLSVLSDFWIKLTRLPVSYFDAHHTGDTLQRINDNKQVQSFLTGTAIETLFSAFNFLIYAAILAVYSIPLFTVFCIGNVLYFSWIRVFLRLRRKLNYETFHIASKENTATLQMVQGMQEIRLNNAERLRRWEWENIQAGVFRLNFRSLNYSQLQSAGGLFLNQGKDILMSFLVAKLVVDGQLTFGAMLAVQYIIGQLNGPVQQMVGMAQSFQDAKISMERLNEIHQLEDEEPVDSSFLSYLPDNAAINIRHLSFTYPGAGNAPVLSDLSLNIPEGKVTAIVGSSGSGKTTLLKLLLKIYAQYEGDVRIGESNFKYISPSFWRSKCGAVLQDGYIFNDTIARNIVVGDEYIDHDRLLHSCRVANILPFVESLPNGFQTKMGANGAGVSQGQRQRLLIARAVYRDPQYLFFDEATNALDANNEKVIVRNLQHFFKGRTVIIVAHRLSTVKDADNIIVMHNGRIAEEGTHASLTSMKGRYFELVRNQLELGT